MILSLSGDWLMSWGDGLHGWMEQAALPIHDRQRYIIGRFPGSIHKSLISSGIIADPNQGINSLQSRWVEEHFWILRKAFTLSQEAIRQLPRLHIDTLDGVANIYLNGKLVGQHANSFRPFVQDITENVLPGENELVILLESGLFHVANFSSSDYNPTHDQASILTKRGYLRQAQYQFGWDWNPRLVFFGLHGRIEVEWGEQIRLEQMGIGVDLPTDLQQATIHAHAVVFNPGRKTLQGRLSITSIDGLGIHKNLTVEPGTSVQEISLPVPQPKLWWPLGYGEPFLYPLSIQIEVEGHASVTWEGSTGIRRIDIAEPPHPETGRYMHLVVNNRPIFCKGANWVPPELSGHEVAPERIDRLVELALEQNINMLRLWAGGVWAGHHLLDLCDKKGILVWHDFLFCGPKLPADNPSFYQEIEKEVVWGIREFGRHPSIALWCGNNEMEEALWDWGYTLFGKTAPDHVVFHHLIPTLVAEYDPSRPYRPSSPYSGTAESANDPTRGDQHPWSVTLRTDGPNFWAYRQRFDRFPNEGGVLGGIPYASLKKFLSNDELRLRSFAWEHHDNTVDFWYPEQGICYRLVDYWLGQKAEEMPLERYALASGLLHAEGLKEYIQNYRRRWPSTAAALYWDFNDSWPSVHGWGTLDYYLNKKPSFHPVRRAFQPVTVVVVDEDNAVGLYAINDSLVSREMDIELGAFPADGAIQERVQAHSILEPQSSRCVLRVPRAEQWVYYGLMRDQGKVIAQDRMLLVPFKEQVVKQPEIQVSENIRNGIRYAQYLCDTWVWAVVLDLDGTKNILDDVFDLLPGIPYEVPLRDSELPCPVLATGNSFLSR